MERTAGPARERRPLVAGVLAVLWLLAACGRGADNAGGGIAERVSTEDTAAGDGGGDDDGGNGDAVDGGEQVAVFDLPAGTIDIDYDPTGTFLITVDVGSVVTWVGRGESGVIGERYVTVSW